MELSSFSFEFSITHQFLVITEQVKDVWILRIIKMIILPIYFQPSRLHIHFALFTLGIFARWHFYNIIIILTWLYDSHETLIHIILLVAFLSLVLGFWWAKNRIFMVRNSIFKWRYEDSSKEGVRNSELIYCYWLLLLLPSDNKIQCFLLIFYLSTILVSKTRADENLMAMQLNCPTTRQQQKS
jgi:hypothetical protein